MRKLPSNARVFIDGAPLGRIVAVGKFTVPTIANGEVYFTPHKRLAVYGLRLRELYHNKGDRYAMDKTRV